MNALFLVAITCAVLLTLIAIGDAVLIILDAQDDQ